MPYAYQIYQTAFLYNVFLNIQLFFCIVEVKFYK